MSPGGGFPPGDIVERMVICYQTPPLAYEHLHATCALLPYVVPELEDCGVLESAVQVYLLLTRIAKSRTVDRLLELSASGHIGKDTQDEFEQIVSDLWRLIKPCLELGVYWRRGNPSRTLPPSGRLQRRR